MDPTGIPELGELDLLATAVDGAVEVRRLGEVVCGTRRLPLHVFSLGNSAHDLPLDNGPWVLAQVRLWLERLGPEG